MSGSLFSLTRQTLRVEVPDGRGFRFYRHKFNPRRWRNDQGIGHEGRDGAWRRVRMYQLPLGLLHVFGRWGARG